MPAALGYSLTEALYTAFLPYFGDEEGPTRRRLAHALRLTVPVALVAGGAYALILVAARPDNLGVWVAFTGLIAAQPLAGVYAAFLTAERRYALATLRVPFITAVGFAAALVLLSFWGSITAIATGLTIGYVAQLALLVVLEPRRPAPAGARAPRPHVLGPATSVFIATLVGGQLVVLLERALASTLATGSVTLLANARGFVLVPAMAAQALASGVFPAASERFRELGREGLAQLALTAIRLAALIGMVSAAYVAVCRSELIEVVLQRGEFDAADAQATARLIAIMAASLLGISVAAVAGRALFGMGRQRFVAIVSGAAVVLYAIAAVGLRDVWEVDGLAAAFLISSLATGVVLAGSLVRWLELPLEAVLRDWVLAPLAFTAAFTAAAGATWLAVGRGSEGVAAAIGVLALTAVAGLAALGAAIFATRGREYQLARAALGAR